tara:strand:+ start:645 stop:2288 length:1644 start_codon:yes stop_codon:yes gene_type:complete
MPVAIPKRSRISQIVLATLGAVFKSSGYNLTLWGSPPKALTYAPEPIWNGEPGIGNDIILGKFHLSDGSILTSIDPWSNDLDDRNARAELHTFTWLRDLAEAEDMATARERLQTLVRDWITQNDGWSPLAWRSDILAERVSLWLEYYDRLFAASGKSFRILVVRHLKKQLKHLHRVTEFESDSVARFTALKGLICGAMCLPTGSKRRSFLIKKLEREIDRQILEDGGHKSRCPSTHHYVLRRLIEIRSILAGCSYPVPTKLENAIGSMAPALRFFRHQDGGLSLFNGSQSETAEVVDRTLIKADSRGQPSTSLPIAGFERFLSGRILALMDTGGPPPAGFDDSAHAGTLSLEISIGRERLVTNCGAVTDGTDEWRNVQRTTAAHSTLSLENRNSIELVSSGGIGERQPDVRISRDDDDESFICTAAHNGYAGILGTTHSRAIKLSKHSEKLDGIDQLFGRAGQRFDIRFHLHPAVSASIMQNGNSAILKLPKGGGWQFASVGADLSLEDSVFLDGGTSRRSKQLVISGETAATETEVSWSIHALGER